MAGSAIGREERWIKHYSSCHAILLVGEGDFSFSLCLAKAFGSGANIIATSLDTYDELVRKYKHAKFNLFFLELLGASLLHGVDATMMMNLPQLQFRKFHRIIFNFPHAGFFGKETNTELIMMHRNLVHGFLANASTMLCPDGEIHVSHKIKAPYNQWKIEDLGYGCSLLFVGFTDFKIQDYPGYSNKRGSSFRSDQEFQLGECRTFKYILHPNPPLNGWNLDLVQNMTPNFHGISVHNQPPIVFDQLHPVIPPTFNGVSPFDGSYLPRNVTNECFQIFRGYLDHAMETFGSTDYAVDQSVRDALRIGFQTYTDGGVGSSLSGYVGILEELLRLCVSRSDWLKTMLSYVDQNS